jgi:hypothetical protein
MTTWFVTVISSFYVGGPLFSLLEVGSFPGTGCLVPQSYATVGYLSYPKVLGHNRQPTVPRVNYPDKFELGN